MSLITRTDVTAVKLYDNYILAGIGSWTHVYARDSAKLLQRIQVLDGQKIYSFIPSNNNNVLVFGGKQFSILTLSKVDNVFTKSFNAIICSDWLHSGIWTANNQVALLTAHNVVQNWDTIKQSLVSEYIGKENSILYSGLLLPLKDDILVFSGTVFSKVLIHRCGSDAVLHSLEGHKGVIFSVSCNTQKGVIVTTSDDRSVRIWQLGNNKSYVPNSIDYWETINITCIHELYGHLARVMRNCIRNDFVISVGEDSLVCFWGYNGTLLRKISSAHQNACIWSLDADDNDLVTGGSDSAIIIHPLSMVAEYGKAEVLDVAVTNAKKVVFTARKNIVIMTEKDDLLYYNTYAKTCTTLKLKHESTYKLLSISSCKQIIAIIDMLGNLDIYIESCKGPPTIQKVIDTKLEIGKILSMNWAGNRHLVLCTEVGAITVLASKDNTTELFANFVLPPCKERWLTAAAINVGKNMFVVGDRCGSLHVFITGQKNPKKSFKNIHSRYGPTSINIRNDEVVTTGRDATVKYFRVNKSCDVKFMFSKSFEFQWVETFVDKDERYVCGFQERIFVVYDIKSNSKLFEVLCGGGRRSWDVVRYIEKVDNQYEEFIKFVYLKNGNINLETFELSKIIPRNVICGIHSKEINCLKTYRCKIDLSLTFFISGGEDTSLRISTLDSNMGFQDEVTFKQLSSIRTLKFDLIENDKMLVVSAGGRAQICIKLLQFEKHGNKTMVVTEELCDYLIRGTDKERKINRLCKNDSIDFDPETRVMDVEIIKRDVSNFIILAGCSDAYLRIFNFKYSTTKSEYKLEQEIKHHDTCILKTYRFEYQNKTLLITCTTRGVVTFWDVIYTSDLKCSQLNPFTTFSINKSGINSLDCKVISATQVLLATGGDDNTVNLILIEITEDLVSSVKSTWSSNTLHCSQVTGLAFVDDVIVCTSIDQRVTLLRWTLDGGIQCEFVSQVFSDVADVQGLDVLKHDSESITVCVYGKGIEVLSVARSPH